MATSIEALRRDGIQPGREGLVDDAVELLSEAAADVLSVKAGAKTPDELPVPPAPPAPNSMDLDAPPAAETPAAAPAADDEGSVGAPAPGLDALAAAPAPAPAPAAATPRNVATDLADLGVRVDVASAAANPFLLLLDKVAQAARPVKDQERIGKWSNAE